MRWGFYSLCSSQSFLNCTFGESGWCQNVAHAKSSPLLAAFDLASEEEPKKAKAENLKER